MDIFQNKALFDVPIMTSIKKEEDDFQWLGGIAASILNWAPDQPAKSDGKCASILENLFSAMPCEQPTNFMCESPEPKGFETKIKIKKEHFIYFKNFRVPDNFQLLPIDDGLF